MIPPQWRQILHSQAELVLAFLGCRVSCRGLAVRVQQPPRTGAASRATENTRGSPQGSWDWQDHPVMEADFAWPGQACASFSGLWAFSRGLAVLGAALRGCSPSRRQAGQGRESPCSGWLPANGEASPPGWQAASGPARALGVGGGGMHWEAQLSDSWRASELIVAWEVFYGGPPFILSLPQHWHLVSPADPALLPVSL